MENNINLQDIFAKLKNNVSKTSQPLTEEQKEKIRARFLKFVEKIKAAKAEKENN